MLFVSPERRHHRSASSARGVVLPLLSILIPMAIVGCSDHQHESAFSTRDELSATIRLVQASDQPPIEVIPTPLPDGVPDPKPVAPTPVPAAPAPKTDIKPEMVPAPDGSPELDTNVVPRMAEKAAPVDTVPKTQPALSVKDVIKEAVSTEKLADGEFELDGPEDYRTWATPDVAIIVTGQQHGYIEPCGCTGLDRQKGGVARRFTFMQELRSRGWNLLPIDAGNQVRRYGPQSEIKLQQTAQAFKAMDYQLVGFGPDDVRLGVDEILAIVLADSPETALYASANVTIVESSLMPRQKVVNVGGMRIGVTSILDPDALLAELPQDITVDPAVQSARTSMAEMEKASTNYRVLAFFGKEDAASALVRQVPGFDLVVVGGGFGEPTYKPQAIEGSSTKMIVTGNKAMYAGVVGLYANEPMKYARVALTHEFEDAPEMRQLMKNYQDQLKAVGLEKLGLKPIPHLSGEKFVGTATCANCHKSAFEVWETSAHAEATDHIVEPPKERGDIPRHFDPECISCHVTGWDAQGYRPYESGYLSLEQSAHLTGNGCENCHGPGSSHSEAEQEGSGFSQEAIDELRLSMRLPLEKAKERCMDCHDLDNSPDFHVGDAFEDDYWPQVEHYGVD